MDEKSRRKVILSNTPLVAYTAIQNKDTLLYASNSDSGGAMVIDREYPDAWEEYTFFIVTRSTVAILAHSNNRYLGINDNGELVNDIYADKATEV